MVRNELADERTVKCVKRAGIYWQVVHAPGHEVVCKSNERIHRTKARESVIPISEFSLVSVGHGAKDAEIVKSSL